MAGEVLSPNMNLPVPGVSVTGGPAWATDLNNCLSLIDSHTHTSGSGVPITPDAISMTSDLPFLNQSATGLKSTQYTAQTSLSTARSLYSVGVDLYYTDGNGIVIPMTTGGGVAGSPGNISNLTSPASAAYSAAGSKFIWQSGSNIAADMDFGAAIMRNLSPNSTFALTLQPPSSLGSNYSITLPSLPASQKFMTLDASGNMTAPWTTDNTTIEISANALQVKNNSITPAKQAVLNYTLSSSSGNYSTSSTSFTTVTNMSASITTRGAPVRISFQPDGSTSNISGFSTLVGGSSVNCTLQILRDGVTMFLLAVSGAALPPNVLDFTDTSVTAGTYTYSLQVKVVSSTVFFQYNKMLLQETAGGV